MHNFADPGSAKHAADRLRRTNNGPAILIRTPYGREQAVPNGLVDPRLAADRGYAVVVQDVRGRGGSDGEFEPYVTEADDGYDSVEWVADQQWCDGRVVMAGMSSRRRARAASARARAGLRATFPRWDQAGGAGPRLVRDGSSLELMIADI